MTRITALVLVLSLLGVSIARAGDQRSAPGIRASAARVRFTNASLVPPLRMTPGPVGLTSKKVRAGMAYGMLGALVGGGFGAMADRRPDGGTAVVMGSIGGIIGAVAGLIAASR